MPLARSSSLLPHFSAARTNPPEISLAELAFIAFAIVAVGDHLDKLLNKLLAAIRFPIERALRDIACPQLALVRKSADIEQTPDHFHSVEAVAIDQIAGRSLDIEAFGVRVKSCSNA